MTNWWEVSAAWAGAAGSFAAVVVALYIAGRGWRDAADRETRAQAQLVHCYTDWAEPTHGNKGAGTVSFGPVFVVRNGSSQPIYKVRGLQEPKFTLAMVPAGDMLRVRMTAAQAKVFGFQTPAYQGPYPVTIAFSDAAGLRWVRETDGSLVHIRVRGPGKLRRMQARIRQRITRS